MKAATIFLLASALTACDGASYGSAHDQCLRTEIFIRCLRSVTQATNDVVEQCADAATWQSVRLSDQVDKACRPQ